MTSILTFRPAAPELDHDRAALVDSVAALLDREPVKAVAVVRAFDRVSREARDAVNDVVRAHGGHILDLTAATCAGGGVDLPAVDLVVAVSRSSVAMAEHVAQSKGARLLAV